MTDPSADWTFAKVLHLMDEQGRTGVLEVGTAEAKTRVHMRKGYVVGVEQSGGGDSWVLAEYLVQSGTVGAAELLEAKKEATKKSLPLEEIMVERKLVSEDVLKRFMDQQHAELLFPLFRREGLNIRFVEERPVQSRFATALPVSYVLKEADRQAEQWPDLRQRIGRPAAVYRRDGTVMAEVLGYSDPDPDAEEPLPDLSANARIIYFFTNGQKTVEQVARASGLTLFDTYKAMNELLEPYLIELVTTHGDGERPTTQVSGLPRVVAVVTTVLILAMIALSGQWISQNLDSLRPSPTSSTSAMDEVMYDANFANIEQALQLYRLRHGSFPGNLQELQRAGMVERPSLESADLLGYATDGETYSLTWLP